MNKFEIIGRPMLLSEPAPSHYNGLLKICANEYYNHQIIYTIRYLISEEPIDAMFWKKANYEFIEFKYNNKKMILSTNHGSEQCICNIINNKLDISDLILDLYHLLIVHYLSDKEINYISK